MNRLILLLVVVVIGVAMPSDASAQFDLGKAWNKFVGNDKDEDVPEPTRYDKLKTNAPAKSDILGTWYYAAAKVDYFGDSMLADIAIDQLDGIAQSMLIDNCVEPGYFAIDLTKGGDITGTMGHDSMSGEYTYDKDDASVTLTVVIEGVTVVCNGYVEQFNNRLKIYIDARDILKAYESFDVGYTGSVLSLARDVISQFDDIYVAVSFSR
jgi:hypothetical protein